MQIIFEVATGNIKDFIDGNVSGLANGLGVVNLLDYSGNKSEKQY